MSQEAVLIMERWEGAKPEKFGDALELEERCWKLYLQGATTRTIAAKCGRSAMWASFTIRKFIDSRNNDTKQSVRGHVEKLLDELNLIRQESWKGWAKSRRDKVRKVDKTVVNDKGCGSEESTTTEGQAGDPAFLRVLIECGKRESALRGIEKPTQVLFQFMQTHVDLDMLIEQVEAMRIQEAKEPIDPSVIESLIERRAGDP